MTRSSDVTHPISFASLHCENCGNVSDAERIINSRPHWMCAHFFRWDGGTSNDRCVVMLVSNVWLETMSVNRWSWSRDQVTHETESAHSDWINSLKKIHYCVYSNATFIQKISFRATKSSEKWQFPNSVSLFLTTSSFDHTMFRTRSFFASSRNTVEIYIKALCYQRSVNLLCTFIASSASQRSHLHLWRRSFINVFSALKDFGDFSHHYDL